MQCFCSTYYLFFMITKPDICQLYAFYKVTNHQITFHIENLNFYYGFRGFNMKFFQKWTLKIRKFKFVIQKSFSIRAFGMSYRVLLLRCQALYGTFLTDPA